MMFKQVNVSIICITCVSLVMQHLVNSQNSSSIVLECIWFNYFWKKVIVEK